MALFIFYNVRLICSIRLKEIQILQFIIMKVEVGILE